MMLEEAGIDTSIFGAHSTRSALTSAAARAGITTGDILKLGVRDFTTKR